MQKTVLELLERSKAMLHRTLADFVPDDYFVRATPAANHACWMLGHLTKSEAGMMKMVVPEFPVEFPADWATRFTRDTASSNDRAAFPSPADVVATFDRVRDAIVVAVQKMTDSDFSREIPSPFSKGTMTTVEFMAVMPAMHSSLHLGQIQVIRRALGKPILF